MSSPPAGTVLQVQCGSCLKIVNVPANFLDQLLLHKMYNCPHCKSRQSIHLSQQQETALRFQARQMMQAADAEKQQQPARPQAQPQRGMPATAAAQLAALQLAAAAAAARSAQQGGSAQEPAAAAVLHALHAVAAAQQKASAGPASAAASAARPASMLHSASGSALQQLAQLQQLLQKQQAAAAAAAAGSRPGGPAAAASLSQQQLDLLRQLAERSQKAAAALGGGGGGGGSQAQLAAAQLARFLPLPNEPSPDEEDDADDSEVRDTFMEYKPAKLSFGRPHPDPVVETASLAAVEPPDITYQLKAHSELVESLSALQLESVVYACQRHEQMLPDGSRGGFFIGDGAGVGKGRTIAGLVLENWRQGRRKHLWLSVGSDLKIDSQRDLDDVGAADLPLHALNKLPYGKLAGHRIGVKEGVIFLTYSSLISSSDRGLTRFKQLVEWCGKDFDGLIVFDESHKAKNLVPDAGMRATQVGLKVRELQLQLPAARIVYCSATGASEPRNMGYMVRLGLWGEGNPAFRDFGRFLDAVQGKGGPSAGSMAALELVAMDMKAQGMYVCRTLSFAGAEFETVEAPLEEPIASQYAAAAATWNRLFREFLYAEEQAAAAAGDAAAAPSGTTAGEGGRRRGGFGDARSMTWRSFWAGHQAFFRHMTMAAKVPAVVRMARAAVAAGKCAVIGLQSTGEARTADVVADRGDELDDFVSGPKELLLRLVDNYYPLPPDPYALSQEADSGSDDDYEVAAVADAVARNALEGRDQVYRGAKARAVRYKEWSESESIGISSSSSSDSSSGSDSDDEAESSSASDGGSDGSEEGAEAGGAGTKRRQGSRGAKEEEAEEEEGGTEESPEVEEVPVKAPPRRRQARSATLPSGASSVDGGSGKERRNAAAAKGAGAGGRPASRRRKQQEQQQQQGKSRSRRSSRRSSSSSSDSGDEYDPIARPSEASGSSSSSDEGGSGGEEGGKKRESAEERERRREERREAKRVAAQMAALRREQQAAAYQEALKRKESVLAAVQQLELPSNPLDTLIDQLGGPAKVAEMTGRKGRLVRSKSSGGVVFEARNASGVAAGATLEMINVHERELFLGGQKLVAVISEAASAGISLHADRRAVNQRRRVHLTLELPWSADKAIQQFGRTHRANQAHGPQYRLIFTPLGGERRFAAAVARRLESLGALTQGDRRAGPSLSAFNYESVWGQRALREMYRAIMGETRAPLALPQPCRPGPSGEPPRESLEAFLGRARALLLNCGIIRHNRAVVSAAHINDFLSRPDGAPPSVGRIDEKDMADVPRFLNRLLGLEPEAQQALFDFYQATLEALMDKARREGALDEGIVDVRAHSVSLVGEPRVLHRDATSGAATVMYEVELDRGLPWADAQLKLEEHRQAAAAAQAGLLSPAAVPAVLASIPAAEADDAAAAVAAAQQVGEQQQLLGGGPAEAAALKLEGHSQQPSDGALPRQHEQADGSAPPSPARKGKAVKEEAQEQQKPQSPTTAGRKRRKAGSHAGAPAAAAAAADGAGAAPSPAKRRRANGSAGASASTVAAPSPSPAKTAAPSASPAKSQQQQKRGPEEAKGDAIDLTLSDSEAEGQPAPAGRAVGKKQKQEASAKASDDGGAADSGGGKAVEAKEEDGKATPAKPAAKRKWESGFYRARQEGINRQVHVLLALQVAGSEPPTFTIHRPATGRSRQIMSLQELKARYLPLEPATCQPLWEKAFGAAGEEGKKSGAVRKKRVHVLGGAVMRSWGAVQAALVRHVKAADRRMRVLRIATTGDQPQRLVGMLIPEPAVEEVVAQLGKDEEGGKGDGEEARSAGKDAAGSEDVASGGGQAAEAAPKQAGGKAAAAAKPAVSGAAARRRAGGRGARPVAERVRRQQPSRGGKPQQRQSSEAVAIDTEGESSSHSSSSDDEQSSSSEASTSSETDEETPDAEDSGSSGGEESDAEPSKSPAEPSSGTARASGGKGSKGGRAGAGRAPPQRQQPTRGRGVAVPGRGAKRS